MVANTFDNNIPGWVSEEEIATDDSVPHSGSPTNNVLRAVNNETWVEIEISTTNGDNDDPLLALFQELGFSTEMIEDAVHRADEVSEFYEVEAGMEELMPSTDSITQSLFLSSKLQEVVRMVNTSYIRSSFLTA